MARQRRGGGFRPPELRGTLGTLLRTTLAQAGTLRDVLERGAREGRTRLTNRLDSALSDARSSRRRHDALAELGDLVLDLIRRGEIDLDELPEARDIVSYLDELDADTDADHDADHDEPPRASPARNRFDARGRASRTPRDSGDSGTPSNPARNAARNAARNSPRDSDDDGTVSSQSWSRQRASKPQPRVWRPPADADTADTASAPTPKRSDDEITARDLPRRSGEPTSPSRPSQRRPSAASSASAASGAASADDRPTEPGRPSKRKDPARKGGIHFDDDDDLAEYMHPDDVPPKGRSDGDS